MYVCVCVCVCMRAGGFTTFNPFFGNCNINFAVALTKRLRLSSLLVLVLVTKLKYAILKCTSVSVSVN